MGLNVEASTIGLPTSRWLHKQKKTPTGSPLRKKLIGALSFVDRIISYHLRCAAARYFRFRGQVVILDRYIYDSGFRSPPRPPASDFAGEYWKAERRFRI